jgi:hypothetical protein
VRFVIGFSAVFLETARNYITIDLSLSLSPTHTHTHTHHLLFPITAALEIMINTNNNQLLAKDKDKIIAKIIWQLKVPLLH